MADIAPIDPLRYDLGGRGDAATLSELVAPPYDVVDAELRAVLAARHRHNVVHLDLPEGGDERYERARQLWSEWRDTGVLVRDGQPAFFGYEQRFEPPGGGARLTRRGFFGLVRAVPFADGSVLPHERTLSGPKLDRLALSRATRAALSPGFMLYPDPAHGIDDALSTAAIVAEFSTDDGVEHRLSRVTEAARLRTIVEHLASARLLIADGHHRYETALGLADEIEREHVATGGAPSPRGEHRFLPVFLANEDDPGLVVFPTHRLVHSLAACDFDAIIAGAAPWLSASPLPLDATGLAGSVAAGDGAAVAVVAGGRAALLTPRAGVDLGRHAVLGRRPEIVRKTSVALLHDILLEGVLGIDADAQARKINLRYLQDARAGLAALERGDGQALFVTAATPVRVIRAVAEAGEVMPQKSTYFHPKVPTGLLFHSLDPTRAVP